ncbi:MAG: hypothetical protein AAFU64_05995 [Bacteroidota bacterium]
MKYLLNGISMKKWIYFLIAVNALFFLSSLLLRKNPVDAVKETLERRQKAFFESELEKEKKARKFQKFFKEYCENLEIPKASQMILNRDRSLSVFVKNYLALRLQRAAFYMLDAEDS